MFTQAFATLAAAVAQGQGIADLHRIIFPHPLNDRPEQAIRDATTERVAAVAAALTAEHGEGRS